VRSVPRAAPGSASPAPTTGALPIRSDEPNLAGKPAGLVARESQKVVPPKRGILRIARLKHAGDWNIAPQAIPNLSDALRMPPARYHVALAPKDLFPRDPNLVYYPLVWIQGRGTFSFTDEDLDALRRHLDPGGGTLFADAACGNPAFDRAFRHFVAHLYPDRKLEPIPRDDEVYHFEGGFDLYDCQYTRVAGGGKGLPQLEGVKINGHWAVIYSKFGVGCALDRHSETECKGYTRESAVRILCNIVIDSTLP
jgi:hypothetical protein